MGYVIFRLSRRNWRIEKYHVTSEYYKHDYFNFGILGRVHILFSDIAYIDLSTVSKAKILFNSEYDSFATASGSHFHNKVHGL
jgi:hypothetical protein